MLDQSQFENSFGIKVPYFVDCREVLTYGVKKEHLSSDTNIISRGGESKYGICTCRFLPEYA